MHNVCNRSMTTAEDPSFCMGAMLPQAACLLFHNKAACRVTQMGFFANLHVYRQALLCQITCLQLCPRPDVTLWVQDSYLWAGPLTYMIKTILATFIIAAVLRPFRGQRRTAVRAESMRAAGLRSTLSQMFLDRWDKVFGRRLTTKQVSCMRRQCCDLCCFM